MRILVVGAGVAQLVAGGRNGALDGLYPADSPVFSLSSSALAYAVQGSSSPVLIEFYAEWCGHCQHYASTYVKVAEAMKREVPSVLVAAINCATHTSDCSAHGVHSYPTLKLFGAPADAVGAGLLLDGKLREPAAVVGFVRSSLSEQQRSAAALPGRVGARALPSTQQPDSRSGATGGARVASNNSSGTAPANLSLAAAGSAPATRAVRALAEPDYDLVARLPARPQHLPIPAADVLMAARWSLLHEISSPENELETDEPAALQRFGALQMWVQALHRGLPWAADGGMAVAGLAELGEELRSRQQKMPTPLEWQRLMERLAIDRWGAASTSAPQPTGEDAAGAESPGSIGYGWAMCSSSRPARHAYPCGLWLLFHTLMAHAEPAHAMQTLEAIAGYVDAFFGCDECAAHFHTLTASMHVQLLSHEARRRSRALADGRTGMAEMRDRAELWLWAAHNTVNDRLRGEVAGGLAPFAEFAPYQWPSRAQCPGCYDAAEVAGGRGSPHHRVLHNRGWVDGAVLDFLHRAYCLDPAFACWGEHERWATERAATEAYWHARRRMRAGAAGAVAMAMLLGALVCWAWPSHGQRTGGAAGSSGGPARARAQYWAGGVLRRIGKAKAHHVI